MAMELIGAAGMTNELKQFYDRQMLSVADMTLVFHKYGLKRPIPARGGKSIEIRRFEKIAVSTTALTEGTPPAPTQGTISTVTATISQYGQYSQVSDVLELQAYDPIIDEYAQRYGMAMAESIDTVIRDVVDATTTVQYASSSARVGTSGTTDATGSGQYLTAAEILEADRTLSRAGARKIDGRWICFIHPDNKKDLFEDPDIVNSFQLAAPRDASNPMFTGVLGDWGGVRFVETNNLDIEASYGMSGADIYEVVMCGAEAYAVTEFSSMAAKLIVHPKGTGGHTDPLDQYSTIGWKAALAAVILNQSFLVKIYCASSRSNAA